MSKKTAVYDNGNARQQISETLNPEKVIAKSRTYSKPRKQELQNGKGVIVKLKEYECVEVKNHSDVGRTIKEWQQNGWRLHTYQATGTVGMATAFVNHYLLFEKGE